MSSYSKMHFHIVFSTQHRAACLNKRWRDKLWAYMAGTINGLDGHARAFQNLPRAVTQY